MQQRIHYPFTAIVGQEQLKTALILNLINPSLGGVLIRGEKGTAKSTAVRGLTELLDEVDVIDDCQFHCRIGSAFLCEECEEKKNPSTHKYRREVVELPVSATEDRVVGSLDMEKAIREGKKSFEPGILAQANGNILYVDEINLLDDHIVDILLDSAAMGINTVEREGISYSHPARFCLVGTMNPEEGDLRPQLLDRFGMVVDVVGEREIEQRKELIKRRLEFEQDSETFIKKWEPEQNKLKKQIEDASRRLQEIVVPEELYELVAKLGIALKVDGHRADIALLKTAITMAALKGSDFVTKEHIRMVAPMVLVHRMRKQPFDVSDGLPENWEEVLNG